MEVRVDAHYLALLRSEMKGDYALIMIRNRSTASAALFGAMLFIGLAIYPESDVVGAEVHCQDYWTPEYKCEMGCGPCGGSSNHQPGPSGGSSRPPGPNLIFKDGNWVPKDGYEWSNDVEGDYSVTWVANKPFTGHPHVLSSDDEGVWWPDDGYEWMNDTRGDYRVRWVPNTPFSGHPHVFASDEEGVWSPDDGYEWANQIKGDYRVTWVPNKALSGHPHVFSCDKEGVWCPDDGYEWENDTVGDYSVRWVPNKPVAGLPNVVASYEEGVWSPKAGYEWANSSVGDYSVKPLVDGTPARDYPSVVWNGNAKLRPALGYHWTSSNPEDANFLVALDQGLIANANGSFDLKVGYAWVGHNDPSDVRVRAVPQPSPVNAPLTNAAPNRSAYSYSGVINQFEVGVHPRYAVAEDGATYCNIFAWDVTRAMGAELPHWVINGDGFGSSAVDDDGSFKVEANDRHELDVKATVEWLNKSGKYHGWRRISYIEAQPVADDGRPTIVVWDNPNGVHGHIAIVRPGSIDDSRGDDGVAEAQAGALVNNATHLYEGFGLGNSEKAVQYWVHD